MTAGASRPTSPSFLLLTEDSGAQAFDTLAGLLGAILALLAPQADLSIVQKLPLDDERLKGMVRANLWKSENEDHRRILVDLRRRIAGQLLKVRASFVVFHVDGDTTWQSRSESENAAKFLERIAKPVQRLIDKELERRVADRADRAAQLGRLFLWMPHYSIESWLYQNTVAAVRLSNDRYGGSHVAMFEAWGADRAQLDEVLRPKEETCLRDRHNAELASSSIPLAEVDRVEKSLTAALASMRACPALVQALASAASST